MGFRLQHKKNLNIWFLILFLLMIIFGYTLHYFNYFEMNPVMIGDSISYVMFPLNDLKEMLSSHRTFGLPLIIKIYNNFFNGYELWPYILYFFYCLALFTLFFNLEKIGLNKPLNIIICTSFLINHGMVNGLGFLETETLIQIFLVLILSLTIKYSFEKSKYTFSLLVFLIFYTYQIRPNLAILVFLTPFWIFIICYFLQKNSIKIALKNSIMLLLCSTIILISFISLRYLYTSTFGLASFGGVVISGQATSYLNNKNINNLDGKELALAKKIIQKRSSLSPPCNKLLFTENERNYCGNSFIVASWLSAIELINGTKIKDLRSEDPSINKKLGLYFSINNVEINDLLKNYSLKILKVEKKQWVNRYVYEILRSLDFYISFIFKNGQFLVFYIAFFICLIDKLFLNKIQKALQKSHVKFNNSLGFFIVFQVISLTFIVSGVLTSAAIIHLDVRYLYGLTTFILPSFILLLPIFSPKNNLS